MASQILVFLVDDDRFGLPTEWVREVLCAVSLTPVFQAPHPVMGVFNLRGHITAVVDVRRLLGLNDRPLNYTDHFIVVEVHAARWAVRVDQAIELIDAVGPNTADSAAPEPAPEPAQTTGHLRTDGGLVYVLDLPALWQQQLPGYSPSGGPVTDREVSL